MSTAAEAAAAAAQAAAIKEFDTELFTFLALASCTTVFRTYIRLRSIGLRADDYFAWLGTIFHGIETAMSYLVVHEVQGLANNGLTDAQRASLSTESPEYSLRVLGSKIQLGGWVSYAILLWALKTSLLFLYTRLTTGLGRGYRIRIDIGFALVGATWFTLIMTILLECRPFYGNWQINPNPGSACMPASSPTLLVVGLLMNVISDLYLISIPLPMLWSSSLKPVKKLGLMLIFSGGLLVVACALLRSVLMLTDPENAAQLAGSWSVRETFIAVVTTNLPVVFPFLKHVLTPYSSSLLSLARSNKKTTDPKLKTLRTWGQGSVSAERRRKANPLTNITFTESEERMIELQEGKALPTPGFMPAKEGHNQAFDARGLKNINTQTEVTVVKQSREEIKQEAKRGSLPPLPGNYVFVQSTRSRVGDMV